MSLCVFEKKSDFEAKIWILCAKIQRFYFLQTLFFSAKIQISNLTSIHQNWIFGQSFNFSPSVCYGKSLFKRPLAVGYVLQYVAQHKLASRAFSKMRRSGFCLAFFRPSVGVLQCDTPRCSILFHNENCKALLVKSPILLIIIEEFQR